jgi:hypothetical protein
VIVPLLQIASEISQIDRRRVAMTWVTKFVPPP